MALKRGNEIPTIDVCLVTITPQGSSAELALDTANKIAVEPQTETQDAIKLIVKGKLLAQKGKKVTITGNQITLTDNVFIPELAKILQGGTIEYWTSAEKTESDAAVTEFGVASYTPPVAGSDEKGEVFTLNAYSAVYDSAGLIVEYEKISYPNCQGDPFGLSSEDGVFRVSEYTIQSAPKKGEAPYNLSYVKELPAITA